MTEARLTTLDRRVRVRVQAGALLLVVVALLLTQLVLENRRAARRLDVTLGERTPGLDIAAVAPEGPADRAGLRAGDRVLAVNGKAIADADGYQVAARSLPSAGKVPFLVERDGQRLLLQVRPGMPLGWRNWILNALGALAYLALALLALRQQDNDLRARLLLLFSTAVALELALPWAATSSQLAFVVTPLFYLLTGLQMGLELHLASVIPARPAWLDAAPLGGAARTTSSGSTFAALGILTYVGGRGWDSSCPGRRVRFDQVLNIGFLPVWAFLDDGAADASRRIEHPEPRARQQAALVLAGVLPWAAVVAVRLGHALAGQGSPAWADAIEPLALLGYPVAVAVAISRFQLFDLELVVRRSLVYTALTHAAAAGLLRRARRRRRAASRSSSPAASAIWVVAGATLLLGLLFTPLRRVGRARHLPALLPRAGGAAPAAHCARRRAAGARQAAADGRAAGEQPGRHPRHPLGDAAHRRPRERPADAAVDDGRRPR